MRRPPLPLVALLVLAGCSDPSKPAPAPTPTPCASGQVTFGKAKTGPLLTGVTPVLEATAKGMTLDDPYEEINTRTAGVRAGAGVPAAEVYRRLAAEYEEKRALVEFGTVHHPAIGESGTFDGTGRFVSYEWIRTVEVPFTYTCGGTTSEGTVTSWEAAGRGGVLDCDRSESMATGEEATMIRQVRDLRCDGT